MYQYISRIVAPSVVEFYTPTPQGHRVVRIYLDVLNPRISAFNETSSTRSPATLFRQEIDELIDRARLIVNPETMLRELPEKDSNQ